MQRKDKALGRLLEKSPGLKKTFAPRNAYEFPGGTPNKMMSTTGFGSGFRSTEFLNGGQRQGQAQTESKVSDI